MRDVPRLHARRYRHPHPECAEQADRRRCCPVPAPDGRHGARRRPGRCGWVFLVACIKFTRLACPEPKSNHKPENTARRSRNQNKVKTINLETQRKRRKQRSFGAVTLTKPFRSVLFPAIVGRIARCHPLTPHSCTAQHGKKTGPRRSPNLRCARAFAASTRPTSGAITSKPGWARDWRQLIARAWSRGPIFFCRRSSLIRRGRTTGCPMTPRLL